MSDFVTLGDHISIQKGKAPLTTSYSGPGAKPYLNPEYLRGRANAELAKPRSDAVHVRDGDTILLWDGSNAGEFFKAKSGLAASTMAKITPDERFKSAYFFHATKYAEPYLKGQTNGTGIPHVDRELLEAIRVFCPAPAEQLRLAEILDTLDTTIHETVAIIAKLKAVKQGLLHDLLTRGIDANGELRPPQTEAPHLYKPSPLGWIPKEWEAAQLHMLAELITSGSRGWAAYYAETGALFLRSQNIRMGYLEFTDRQLVKPPVGGEGERTKLEQSDLLITITGNGVGNVAHVPVSWKETAYVSQHVGLVRFCEPHLALLAAHYFVEGAPGNQQIVFVQYGQSKPGLSLGNLRSFWMPIPSEDETSAINHRIASIYERLNCEEGLAHQLRDLKFGLMDDLLTGKVRVTPLLVEAAQQAGSA